MTLNNSLYCLWEIQQLVPFANTYDSIRFEQREPERRGRIPSFPQSQRGKGESRNLLALAYSRFQFQSMLIANALFDVRPIS